MATKKKIKTYGVRGLMEWVCNIPVGKSHMRIEFTGGVLTSYGNTPAKFVTKDLLQQTIIEHSDFFKKKRIVLLSVVDTNEDENKMQTVIKPAEHAGGEEVKIVGDRTDGKTETNVDNPDDSGHPKDDTCSNGERTADGKLIVKVASLDDAKTYLNEKCGIAIRNLRSRANILAAAEANDIAIEIQETNKDTVDETAGNP